MAMPDDSGQHVAFFPRADATVLRSKYEPPGIRPQTMAPIFDPECIDKPIMPWSTDINTSLYPAQVENYAPAIIPDKPECFSDRYLLPSLAKNERLRLTMTWYYTRNIFNDDELLSRLQEKVCLAQESIGWEFAIVGLVGANNYTRLATYGIPLTILPRRETLCAHTVIQPPGTVFLLPNMLEDWRFRDSPHVESGGLHAYAGTPLHLETEFGDSVALGTICMASSTSQSPLDKSQHLTLVRLADWVVSDIVHSARANRERERCQMVDLVAKAREIANNTVSEEDVIEIIRMIYSDATINIQSSDNGQIVLKGRSRVPFSNFEGGLWEDVDYIDDIIQNSNHQDFSQATRAVRVIAAQCENPPIPTFLVVASQDIPLVFDDVDSWFIQACAGIISRIWHTRQLGEAMRAKEKFLRGITHQLRTPIHGILGSVELLTEELAARNLLGDAYTDPASSPISSAGERRDPFIYISTIKHSGQELISTVNSMITLNRWEEVTIIERSSSLYTFRELETELLSEIIKIVPVDARYTPSVIFNSGLSGNCDSVWIDSNLFKNCLLPLLLNAIQNTIQGIVSVTISSGPDSKDLVVDIEDTGCGIHPNDQQRIFEAYEKVDLHSTGAGLGLTLASKFAVLLNGSVSLISSNIGQGSHFRITFCDIIYACSRLAYQRLTDKLKNLPLTFHKVPSNSKVMTLCDHFTNFLNYHGFKPSNTFESSFLLIDHIESEEQRQNSFTQLASDQVAIYLIPASEDAIEFNYIPKNVILVRGPFLTLTMVAALEQADTILSSISTSKTSMLVLANGQTTPPNLNLEANSKITKSQTETIAVSPPHIVKLANLNLNSPISLSVMPTTTDFFEAAEQNHTVTDSAAPLLPTLANPLKLTALLVDDNAINLRIVQMYCNKREIAHCTATNGQKAVDIFLQRRQSSTAISGGDAIDLILMDLQMPICDGIEATRQIRSLEEQNGWKRSVLFIVTGQDSSGDRADAEKAGADEYFVKPVSINVLDRAVKQYFPTFEVT